MLAGELGCKLHTVLRPNPASWAHRAAPAVPSVSQASMAAGRRREKKDNPAHLTSSTAATLPPTTGPSQGGETTAFVSEIFHNTIP